MYNQHWIRATHVSGTCVRFQVNTMQLLDTLVGQQLHRIFLSLIYYKKVYGVTAMDNEMREIRELLIELRVNFQHLNQRVDATLGQVRDQVTRLEERVAAHDKQIWIAVGAAGILSMLLPYLVDAIRQ